MVKINSPTTVAVINMKGGVGKSTITALLARHAAFSLELNVLYQPALTETQFRDS